VKKVGCVIVLLGVLVFMAVVLPAQFWWFVLALLLVAAGIYLIKSR
jgi:hypothetical protein